MVVCDLDGMLVQGEFSPSSDTMAQTVHPARVFGNLVPLAQEEIDALYDRYQNIYGQR